MTLNGNSTTGRLDGRVALITGANLAGGEPNIGGATAFALAAEGAAVVVADLPGSGSDRLADAVREAGGRALAVDVDLREEAQIEAMVTRTVSEFGRLDVLHNNAGVSPEADNDIHDLTTDVWDFVMGVDVRGAMLATKHSVPHMLEQGRGSIINTSSISGLRGDAIHAAYGTAKGALCTFTLYVATQYGARGIRCNAICPGLTLSPAAHRDLPAPFIATMLGHSLTSRLSTPEDQANVVRFLASDDAAMINGQIINTDGGALAHQPWVKDFVAMGAPSFGNA